MAPSATACEDLRPATPADADAIRCLVYAAFAAYVPRLGGRRPAPMEADYAGLIAEGIVHVIVEAKGDIAGAIVLHRKPDHLFVETVAVHPARQGTGLGRRLLLFAEDAARDAGMSELRLYTAAVMTESLALYRRCGWTVIGREAPTGIARVILRKGLL